MSLRDSYSVMTKPEDHGEIVWYWPDSVAPVIARIDVVRGPDGKVLLDAATIEEGAPITADITVIYPNSSERLNLEGVLYWRFWDDDDTPRPTQNYIEQIPYE